MAYLHQQKRDGVWFLIDKSRKPSWIKLGKITRNEARQVLLRYQTERTYLRLGLETPEVEIRLSEMIKEYLAHIKPLKAPSSYINEENRLNHFKETFGDVYLHEMKASEVEKYLSEKQYKPISWRHTVNVLKWVLDLAVERKYLNANPLLKIRLPRLDRPVPKFVDTSLLDQVIDCMKGRVKAYFMILRYTGMRPSEVIKLQASNIRNVKIGKETKRVFLFKASKTGIERVIPVHQKLTPEIELLLKGKKPKDWLFPGLDGGHQLNMNNGLRRALKKAKLEGHGITLYTFRHTVATDMLAKTGDLRAVQTVLGHTSSKTTEIYAHALEAAKLSAIDSL